MDHSSQWSKSVALQRVRFLLDSAAMKYSPLVAPALLSALLLAGCQQSKQSEPPVVAQQKLELGHHSATTAVPKSDAGWVKRFEQLSNNAAGFDGELIFIGDSITQGWEGGGKATWEKYFAKRGALNLGISGDRTQHVLWRLANGNLEGIKPSRTGKRVAVIMIGTNNTGQGGNPPVTNSAEEIADGIVGIVQSMRELQPDTKVLLLGVFPRSEAPGEMRDKIKSINGMAQTVNDRRNIVYLDISEKFLAPNGYITKAVMPDFLHLSARGYEIWAEAIEPTLNEMLR